VCAYVTDVPLDCRPILLNRRVRFISGLCYVKNSSLQFLFNVIAKQELIKVVGLMGLGRNKIGLLTKLRCDVKIVLIVDKCALFCSTRSENLLTFCMPMYLTSHKSDVKLTGLHGANSRPNSNIVLGY